VNKDYMVPIEQLEKNIDLEIKKSILTGKQIPPFLFV
jgi:hypothetical protein